MIHQLKTIITEYDGQCCTTSITISAKNGSSMVPAFDKWPEYFGRYFFSDMHNGAPVYTKYAFCIQPFYYDKDPPPCDQHYLYRSADGKWRVNKVKKEGRGVFRATYEGTDVMHCKLGQLTIDSFQEKIPVGRTIVPKILVKTLCISGMVINGNMISY